MRIDSNFLPPPLYTHQSLACCAHAFVNPVSGRKRKIPSGTWADRRALRHRLMPALGASPATTCLRFSTAQPRRRTAPFLDLMLVIQAQGKHSCSITIPDRFIGVDELASINAGDLPKHCSDKRSLVMSLTVSNEAKPRHTFDSAEMGAIAHLYRGEVYRSTLWRTRLDNTPNWAIVTMGIALSTTFSSPQASPLPLLLVGLLLAVFLGMGARRYRYFNVWRARARWLETNFYAPIFTGEARDDSCQAGLPRAYTAPRHHISFVRAAGRGLRHNSVWIFGGQCIAYYRKITIHPVPAVTLAEFSARAAR